MRTRIAIHITIVCAIAAALLYAAESVEVRPGLQHELQQKVDAFRLLHEQQTFPEHLHSQLYSGCGYLPKEKTDFDVNLYFRVLDRLSMEPGYSMDYFYWHSTGNGRPILYARRVEDTAFTPRGQCWYDTTEIDDDEDLVDSLADDAYNHVIADGTPESFFQLAVLYVMGGQFYLAWHCNYSDYRIVCDSIGVRDILDKIGLLSSDGAPEGQFAASAMQLDLTTRFSMTDSTYAVSLIIFTEWGGFSRIEPIFQRSFPHTVDTVLHHSELEYDCGIMY